MSRDMWSLGVVVARMHRLGVRAGAEKQCANKDGDAHQFPHDEERNLAGRVSGRTIAGTKNRVSRWIVEVQNELSEDVKAPARYWLGWRASSGLGLPGFDVRCWRLEKPD